MITKEFIKNVDSILIFLNIKRQDDNKKHNSQNHLTTKKLLNECFGNKIEIDHQDAYTFCRNKKFIDISIISQDEVCNWLSGEGIMLLREYGSYANFTKTEEENKKAEKKRLDLELISKRREVKWFYPILLVGFIMGLCGVISLLSQLGIINLPSHQPKKVQLTQDTTLISCQLKMGDFTNIATNDSSKKSSFIQLKQITHIGNVSRVMPITATLKLLTDKTKRHGQLFCN